MSASIIDVETAALPTDQLLASMPAFEPAANLKDPAKIEASIAAKKNKWIADAALNPLTGRVLAIGIYNPGGFPGEEFRFLHGEDERAIIHEFWGVWSELGRVVGWNIFQFDLPFLIKRSWKLGVPVPSNLRSGRYWGSIVTDLRDIWTFGDRHGEGTLAEVAKFLGTAEKTGEGKHFADLYARDQAAALEYLRGDLLATASLATRLVI